MSPAALLVAGSYLVGLAPTAQVISRRLGHDPTREGSGNPGASNVYRTAGSVAGALVLVGDVAKGAGPTLVGRAAGGRRLGLLCGAAAVAGHVAPVTRRFRGGKGVATAAGLSLVLYPRVSLALAGLWAGVFRLTRTPSVASVTTAGAWPLLVAATRRPAGEVAGVAAVAALVLARHRDNLARLARGTERRLRPGRGMMLR